MAGKSTGLADSCVGRGTELGSVPGSLGALTPDSQVQTSVTWADCTCAASPSRAEPVDRGYLAFVAWLTLTPQVDAVGRISIIYRVLDALHRRGYLLSLEETQLEFLANIALFVPVGMFLLLLFGTRLWWVALIASFAMTTFIEIAQRSIPGRVPGRTRPDGQRALGHHRGPHRTRPDTARHPAPAPPTPDHHRCRRARPAG
jgi:hypothetical protein